MTALLLEKTLSPSQQWEAARLQKQGLTFTEIADKLRVERASIVQALYWDVVR